MALPQTFKAMVVSETVEKKFGIRVRHNNHYNLAWGHVY